LAKIDALRITTTGPGGGFASQKQLKARRLSDMARAAAGAHMGG